MRVVRASQELESAYRACRSEGQNYFADSTVYIERFVTDPKHIEIQVFGDTHGNVVHLYECECSVQRRHQNYGRIPKPQRSPEVREKWVKQAVRWLQQINYIGAGTLEFILITRLKIFISWK